MTDLRPIYYHEARARLVGNRLRVYMALMEAGPSTPKELAARMGWDVTSVRPRLTEMRQIHAVNTTSIRRNGEHEFRALTAAQMQEQCSLSEQAHILSDWNRTWEAAASAAKNEQRLIQAEQLELIAL